MGDGTRTLTLDDIRPQCELVDGQAFDWHEIIRGGDQVADIGCGHGPLRETVENLGGRWIGIEPFPLSPDIIKAPAENLPFPDNFFDVIIMNAVLEHIPDVNAAFAEVGRTLKPGAVFVGYSAFMECFHEISYHHLSHKALEELSRRSGMTLERLSPGHAFAIDYHCARLIEPFVRFNSWPTRRVLRPLLQHLVRGQLRLLGWKRLLKNRLQKKMDGPAAAAEAELYRRVETLRYASGFTFVIRKRSR